MTKIDYKNDCGACGLQGYSPVHSETLPRRRNRVKPAVFAKALGLGIVAAVVTALAVKSLVEKKKPSKRHENEPI